MSAFSNREKDEIHDLIVDFIKNRKKEYPTRKISDIMEELMEVISYSIKIGIENIED